MVFLILGTNVCSLLQVYNIFIKANNEIEGEIIKNVDQVGVIVKGF